MVLEHRSKRIYSCTNYDTELLEVSPGKIRASPITGIASGCSSGTLLVLFESG